jgi:hypothetical protein
LAAIGDMTQMLPSAELRKLDNVDARNYTAQLNLRAIQSLRLGNNTKYQVHGPELFTQAVGVFILGMFAVVAASN